MGRKVEEGPGKGSRDIIWATARLINLQLGALRCYKRVQVHERTERRKQKARE